MGTPRGVAWKPLGKLGTWLGGGTPLKANAAFWSNGTVPWVSPKDMKVPVIGETEDKVTAAAPVDLQNATIEHIMPQTLSETWIDQLGSDARAVHAQLIDTFGNLTLTGYNAELGNLPFSDKKTKLDNTHIELNRDLLKQAQWTKAEIQDRAGRLFDTATKLWPGPQSEAN